MRQEAVDGMRLSTFFYCVKEGIRNICRNVWFSLASTAIISACIFLFCMFFALVANVRYMVNTAEASVGITVFFDEQLSQADIQKIGDEIGKRPEVKELRFISAQEAWDNFKKEYFAGHEDLAEGFADDNPLAGSASYEIYLNNISEQGETAAYLKTLPGVRKVNSADTTIAGLAGFNTIVGLLSGAIIVILLAVAAFLISNTISTAAAFRKSENQIMRLIGATKFMIRAPFVVEGILLGFVGAALPLAAMYFLYLQVAEFVTEKFAVLSHIITFIPISQIFSYMVLAAMALGVGIGFVGSFFTIRKHLKV